MNAVHKYVPLQKQSNIRPILWFTGYLFTYVRRRKSPILLSVSQALVVVYRGRTYPTPANIVLIPRMKKPCPIRASAPPLCPTTISRVMQLRPTIPQWDQVLQQFLGNRTCPFFKPTKRPSFPGGPPITFIYLINDSMFHSLRKNLGFFNFNMFTKTNDLPLSKLRLNIYKYLLSILCL